MRPPAAPASKAHGSVPSMAGNLVLSEVGSPISFLRSFPSALSSNEGFDQQPGQQ